MFLKLNGVAVVGIDCSAVDIEVDINRGQSAFVIVGLADAAIKEASERIYSAIKNSDCTYPFNYRIIINLAPASLHKEGPAYDFPMAVGVIMASGGVTADLSDALLFGELALDGTLRHTRGVLPAALFAVAHGIKRLFVPTADIDEAVMVEGIEVFAVPSLRDFLDHITGTKLLYPVERNTATVEPIIHYEMDLSFVRGQEFAKRALEIAASGMHNILMSGPPGSGKTLLARSIPSILPNLSKTEMLEVTKIYSVAGLLHDTLMTVRPFRTPHHTASAVALVGGGRNPHPGEITLAHRGVLFLDELPEFSRTVLESLRQPLEDGVITVSRAEGTLNFPARFLLVASQNPCPCGYLGDNERQCNCAPTQIARYQKRVSGPLLDRIDLHIEVPRVNFDKLAAAAPQAENSTTIRERVVHARARQEERFRNTPIHTNSEMRNVELERYCALDDQSHTLLRAAVERLHLSARAYHRVLKVARTIADLGDAEHIQPEHIAEAINYRVATE